MDQAGVSRWRQIEETLSKEIERGVIEEGRRLPNSADLAARFGVNRHTVLRALSHMQSEGLIRMERGRGAYAVVNPMQLRIGSQRWFEQNLLQSSQIPGRRVVSIARLPAPEDAAAALKIKSGEEIVYVVLVGEADGVPINRVSNYFSLKHLPDIDDVFRKFGNETTEKISFGKIFKSFGINDFRRKSIRVRSRTARPEESRDLHMAPNDHILETDVTLVTEKDVPVCYANTSYPSTRIELVLDL